MERNELVRALRCQATVGAECIGDCPYFCREDIPEELREVIGKDYLLNCDCDQSLLDAADLIEAQAREIETLQKQLILRNDELLKLRKQVPQWVSVSERLPEPGKRVLATDGGFVGEFYLSERGQWKRYNVNDHSLLMALDILWWTDFPEPPKEDA